MFSIAELFHRYFEIVFQTLNSTSRGRKGEQTVSVTFQSINISHFTFMIRGTLQKSVISNSK